MLVFLIYILFLRLLEMFLISNGEEREGIVVSMVVGFRFFFSIAYTFGDMGRRFDGDCGLVESFRFKERIR